MQALDRKKFVIDKYTNRIFKRLGIIGENQDAESLRDIIEKEWGIEDIIREANRGEKLNLAGFGIFERKKQKARVAKNPQTRKEIRVPEKKKFVIDKYTNRIFKRLGIIEENQDAESLRDIIEKEWGIEDLKNFHGMLVNLAKDYCKTDPVCSECALRINCNYWKETTLP